MTSSPNVSSIFDKQFSFAFVLLAAGVAEAAHGAGYFEVVSAAGEVARVDGGAVEIFDAAVADLSESGG